MEDTLEFIKTFKKGWEYMNSVEDAIGLSIHELPIGECYGKLLDIYLLEKYGEAVADYIADSILPIEDYTMEEIRDAINEAIEEVSKSGQ